MNINAQEGDKVIYVGTTDAAVKWGLCDDPRNVLIEGMQYVVDHTEIHSWHTKVVLQGVTGKFNSSCFGDAQ